MSHDDLKPVIDFIYLGEVSVHKDNLNQFFNISKDLDVKILAEIQDSSKMLDLNHSIQTDSYISNFQQEAKNVDTKHLYLPEAAKLGSFIQVEDETVDKQNFISPNLMSSNKQSNSEDKIYKFQGLIVQPSKSFTAWMVGDPNITPYTQAIEARQLGIGELEQYLLSKMEKSQTSSKSCVCLICNLVHTKSMLSKHIESVHIQDITFRCEACEEMFKTRDIYYKHAKENHNN